MSPLLLTLGKPLFAFVAGALLFGVASADRVEIAPGFDVEDFQAAPHRHLVEPGPPRVAPIPQVEEAPAPSEEDAAPE